MLKLKLFFLLLITSATANANLIINGGFEDNNISSNSSKVFSANSVTGWEGSAMELWDNFKNLQAFEGDQYAELNAHGESVYSIYQSIVSQAGELYDVSFAYAARTKKNESFLFEIIDASNGFLFGQIIDDHIQKAWSTFETTFEAQSDVTLFRFTSISSGNLGNLIDALSATSASPATLQSAAVSVSEPNLALLFACSIFLLLRRRHSAK